MAPVPAQLAQRPRLLTDPHHAAAGRLVSTYEPDRWSRDTLPAGAGNVEAVRIEERDGYRLWVGGPVPRGATAITLGRLVIVREGRESPYLLRHELVHVRQWRRLGAIGFLGRYLGSYARWRLLRKGHRGAYLRIPLEVEADWVARRQLATAVPVATDLLGSDATRPA